MCFEVLKYFSVYTGRFSTIRDEETWATEMGDTSAAFDL
jgi:hypothetical protein